MIVVRLDSAFYNAAVIGAIRRGGARFSVTVPMNASIRAAIAAIGEDAWTPIRYPRAIWDDQLGAWISDAEVAEIRYTAFASKKGQAVTARLIVRRVRDLNKQAGAGQDELFPIWRYHAVFTDSPFELVQAEGQHRDHAVVEQVFADVTSGPLAHMPSGVFAANAAWLSIAAMAHNLLRAAGALASLPFAKARAATIRRDLIAVAARTARHGRGHLTLHLPEGWHREHEWLDPARRGLRPARRSGLTSPGPGPHPNGHHGHPLPRPRARNPGQAAEQVSGRKLTPGFAWENPARRGRSRGPENLARGLRAAARRGSLPLRGAAGARVRARRVAPRLRRAGGRSPPPGCRSPAGRADPASRGGPGWEHGRGLPVMPESSWDESPWKTLAPGP